MTSTRTTTISTRKVAYQGRTYTDTWLGLRAIHTTWNGERLEGTITRFEDQYPVITFDDGRWARGDLSVELVA